MNALKEQAMRVLPVVAILLSLLAVGSLLMHIKDSRNQQSASFMLEFNNELRNSNTSYSSLLSTIAYNLPIFKPKGYYGQDAIDNYLAMWEILSNASKKGFVSTDMIRADFGYDIEKAYCNAEIKNFVIEGRKQNQNPNSYSGFMDLAKLFLKQDGNRYCASDY